jgi:hypothetical protein
VQSQYSTICFESDPPHLGTSEFHARMDGTPGMVASPTQLARYDHFARSHDSLEAELVEPVRRKGKQPPRLQATVKVPEVDSGEDSRVDRQTLDGQGTSSLSVAVIWIEKGARKRRLGFSPDSQAEFCQVPGG